jgi:hypothetical protein
LILYEDYLRFKEMQEREVLTGFERVGERLDSLNADCSEGEIAADITEARRG